MSSEDVPASCALERESESRSNARPYLWMLLGSLNFTFMGLITHELRDSCDWQLIAVSRSGLAFCISFALCLLSGTSLVLVGTWSLWMRSIAGSMSLIATFFALTRLPVSDVLTLTHMFPIWVGVLSWPMLGEVPSRGTWIALLSGVVGVALIQQPHFTAGNWAIGTAIFASVATAFAMLGLHRLHDLDPRSVVCHFSGVSIVFCIVAFVVFSRGTPIENPQVSHVPRKLLALGVFATVGQLFLTKAFASGSPARISVVGLSQIVFAMVFEIALFHRSFNWITIVGMCLIIFPTATLTWMGSQKTKELEPVVNE